jgi:hypothetical protein
VGVAQTGVNGVGVWVGEAVGLGVLVVPGVKVAVGVARRVEVYCFHCWDLEWGYRLFLDER